jgi:hypothetical protein
MFCKVILLFAYFKSSLFLGIRYVHLNVAANTRFLPVHMLCTPLLIYIFDFTLFIL